MIKEKFSKINSNEEYEWKNEKHIRKIKTSLAHDTKRYAEFLIEPLISCLQLNLNITLNDEEKNEISKNLTYFLPDTQQYVLNPTVIKNSELLEKIDNKNLNLYKILQECEQFHDRKNYLTTFLKTKDSSKFPTIQNALNNLPTVKVDHHISIEKFEELSNDVSSHIKTLAILNEKFNESKDGLNFNVNADFITFLNKARKDLFPFLLQSNDLIFENFLSTMTNFFLSTVTKDKVTSSTLFEDSWQEQNFILKKIENNETIPDNIHLSGSLMAQILGIEIYDTGCTKEQR